jgi:hypothetical protein
MIVFRTESDGTSALFVRIFTVQWQYAVHTHTHTHTQYFTPAMSVARPPSMFFCGLAQFLDYTLRVATGGPVTF